MSNGPATKLNTSADLQKNGDLFADPFEISNIRREVILIGSLDIKMHGLTIYNIIMNFIDLQGKGF